MRVKAMYLHHKIQALDYPLAVFFVGNRVKTARVGSELFDESLERGLRLMGVYDRRAYREWIEADLIEMARTAPALT